MLRFCLPAFRLCHHVDCVIFSVSPHHFVRTCTDRLGVAASLGFYGSAGLSGLARSWQQEPYSWGTGLEAALGFFVTTFHLTWTAVISTGKSCVCIVCGCTAANCAGLCFCFGSDTGAMTDEQPASQSCLWGVLVSFVRSTDGTGGSLAFLFWTLWWEGSRLSSRALLTDASFLLATHAELSWFVSCLWCAVLDYVHMHCVLSQSVTVGRTTCWLHRP